MMGYNDQYPDGEYGDYDSQRHVIMARFIGGSILEAVGQVMKWGGFAGAVLGWAASGGNVLAAVPGLATSVVGIVVKDIGRTMMLEAQMNE